MCRFLLVLTLFVISGCKNLDDRATKVIVGGTLLSRGGEARVPDSVIVISGGKLRATGSRAATPIPQGSERFNASGLFVLAAHIPADREGWINRNATSPLPPRDVIRNASASGAEEPDLVFFRHDPSTANTSWKSAERFLIAGNWQTRSNVASGAR